MKPPRQVIKERGIPFGIIDNKRYRITFDTIKIRSFIEDKFFDTIEESKITDLPDTFYIEKTPALGGGFVAKIKQIDLKIELTKRIMQAQIGTPKQSLNIEEHMKEYFIRWPSYEKKFTNLEWYHIFLDFYNKLDKVSDHSPEEKVFPEPKILASELLKIRAEMVKENWQEAYHLLCCLADPELTNTNHWEQWEKLIESNV